MTNKITLETEFIVAEDVDEENVKHIVGQFFADMVETDRFIDARIVEGEAFDEGEKKKLLKLLRDIDGDDLDQLNAFIEEYTE